MGLNSRASDHRTVRFALAGLGGPRPLPPFRPGGLEELENTGEVGDVVVARIVDVGTKRWRADVNARQHAILMLSSINLPGGEQRRRTAEDQLNMRQFYVEHELMSAEVQAFFHDGAMSLHTRSLKYGKLEGGVLVVVAPSLMKRLRQHFHTFEFGVHAIFGMNGYVWVAPGAARFRDDACREDRAPSMLCASGLGAVEGTNASAMARFANDAPAAAASGRLSLVAAYSSGASI